MSANCLRLLLLLSCVLLCWLFPRYVAAQTDDVNYDWQLKRDRHDIRIYLSKVPDSKFRAVRAEMQVDASIESLVALITDLPNCKKWVAMCQKAELVEQLSSTESIVYTHNNVPFPVRDRDVYSHVVWSHDKETGVVRMRSEAIDASKYSVRRGRVRIVYAVSEWYFKPLANGQVAIESFAHVDPNGAVPAWLINFLIVDAPYKTLKQMRARVQQPQYQNVQVPLFQ